jgi:PAP2 superfamily
MDGVRSRRRSRRRWRSHAGRVRVVTLEHLTLAVLREVVIALGAFFVYFGVRGLTEGDRGLAVANARRLIDFERALGLFVEGDVQSLISGSAALVTVTNWVYIWGHWPVIASVALWLIIARPADYRLIRNAFLVSGAAGLVIFALFPVAPPRFLDLGLQDTVTERSQAYRVLQPQALVNQYAAMPSLHLGWNLLIGIAVVRHTTRALKPAGVLLPAAMAFAVVATANHFIVDAIAGVGLALLGLWAASLMEQHLPPLPGRRGPGERVVSRIVAH